MSLHTLMHHPIMARLRKPECQDWAKFVIRLALGAVFMYHGYGKLTGLDMTAGFFGKLGIPMPGVMAVFIACVEFFGGALMILGLAVRPVAVLLAGTMIVAILKAKGLVWAKSELEISLLAMSLSMLLGGAGGLSLDAKLMKKGMEEHKDAVPMAR